ncbi:sensor histidine kinase [Flavobacterium sp. N1994]|uniref:sensor histidine kinase n=1 Tax=Flavobacterium sp. N1994 TaxID=2986827 RepID=UPI0022235CA3|nr:HAMP domain-containing sensor histidine kinase [Flavobacterium sp. N1994]
MRIKHQLAIFNALTRLLIIVVLWFSLPILIEKVVYKHIDKTLLEKKQKFIEHLDKEEINDFITRNDSTETYSSFSTLHNEFLQLYQSKEKYVQTDSYFKNESRIIEEEQNDYRILYYTFEYENTTYKLEIGISLDEIKDLTFVIRLFILIVLCIVVVFTFLVDTVFVEYLLKPFYRIINKKIRNVNAPERFDYTTIQSHSTDFKELDEVLNQMMKRIQEHFSNEKQFIANVSHELMSPIALLKNRFENLLQNESINDEGIDKIASSLRTLDLLKKIINNLLLISKIENNQFVNNEQISIKELVQEIMDDFEDRIEEKGIAVVNEIKEDFIFLGNKTLIRIMIYNLLLNAIKYNIQNGKIILNTNFSGDHYWLTISDTGKGMSDIQLTKIFDRFTRIDLEQEGQGLGLAIVDSIAKFHHIEIKVASTVTVGTTFVIQFPVTLTKKS